MLEAETRYHGANRRKIQHFTDDITVSQRFKFQTSQEGLVPARATFPSRPANKHSTRAEMESATTTQGYYADPRYQQAANLLKQCKYEEAIEFFADLLQAW